MKRDLFIWKETYSYEKRPLHMKRDLFIWMETYSYQKTLHHIKRHRIMWKKTCRRDLFIWKETYSREKRPFRIKRHRIISKDTESYEIICGVNQKRPIQMKRDLYKWPSCSLSLPRTWEDTYSYEKTPNHVKKDLFTWKETYSYGKRPIHVKRDLYSCEKRPLQMTCLLSLPRTWDRPVSWCCYPPSQSVSKETYSYEKRPVKETYLL